MKYTIQVDVDDMVEDDLRLVERRNITDNRDPRELAAWLARQHAAVGDDCTYHARVWLGHDASPDTEPAATTWASRSEDAP
ncbi:hypothetical protein [Nocardia gamkensis]|uniref:hypothetical protein n=1 Tax=Nocardia gamkensis TaxID=352869 RepID=UPI0037C8F4E7